MRQVPQYLLIGNGRVSRHFQHYFSLLHIPFAVWQRSQSLQELQQQLVSATHVLVLISDGAIEAFIAEHIPAHLTTIHCSGALVTDKAIGAHPLMTFSQDLYDLEQYQRIPFIIDADAPDFQMLFPSLDNPHVRLDKAAKAKYHALCVMSGNFSCILWQKLFSSLQTEFAFPQEIAFPYFEQQAKNILKNPATALTGPLVRGDEKTIQKNIAALKDDPFQAVYQSFVACYKKITEELSHENP